MPGTRESPGPGSDTGVVEGGRAPKMPRPSWDQYFMEIARVASKRSTCLRRQVGAIVVKDKRILATGYNGAPAGLPHCEDMGGCLREKMRIPPGEKHELCRGTHAEQNAIIQSANFGASIKDATIYCTHRPCSVCAKMIINAGLVRVVVSDDYPDELAGELFEQAGISVEVLTADEGDPGS